MFIDLNPYPDPIVEGESDPVKGFYGIAVMAIAGIVFMLSLLIVAPGTIAIVFEMTRRPDV
jgi:hypothetical protein